jgi:SSS family solute:Na+ symporter
VSYLSPLDYGIVIAYVVMLLGFGAYLQGRASASVEDYFLGGRKLPWWMLGTSGMAAWLDTTGTMLIVSFLFMFGPQGLFIEFRGGAVLILPFMLTFMGKWHRRSNCMTAVEWNIYRFGPGAGGQTARLISGLVAVLGSTFGLVYMIKGVGLFLGTFIDLPPTYCAAGLLGVATVYTLLSGFYGVIITDLIQSIIIVLVAGIVIVMAGFQISGHEGSLGELAKQVTGNPDWLDSGLTVATTALPGYEPFRYLMLSATFFILKNIALGMGGVGAADPKYFGARNERECGLMSYLTMWLIAIRWPLMMAFAALGLFLMQESIPDQTLLLDAANAIKAAAPDLKPEAWADHIGAIIQNPDAHTAVVEQLKAIFGAELWTERIRLVSFEGGINPERILPWVLLTEIPTGLRGLLMIALLAASMSTFDSNLNSTAAIFTRDLYQGFIRPKAGRRESLFAAYIFAIGSVSMSFVLSRGFSNINDIWNWLIMGLGTGLSAAGIIRFYWWRFNAAGFIGGTVFGMLGAFADQFSRINFAQTGFHNTIDAAVNTLVQAAAAGVAPLLRLCGFDPTNLVPELIDPGISQFIWLTLFGIGGAIACTYLSQPTDRKTLEHFYRTTRPFGWWKPFRSLFDKRTLSLIDRENRMDLLAIPFAMLTQVTLFLVPMQLLIGTYTAAGWTFALHLLGQLGMYGFWYRQLPPADRIPGEPPKWEEG